MTLVPFAELPVNGFTRADDPFRAPAVPDPAYTPAPTVAEQITAAFRQDNTVASFLTSKTLGFDNHDDGAFDPLAFVDENNLRHRLDLFEGVMNRPLAEALKAQIEQEEQDRKTREASGFVGTLAGLAAGVVDLPMLIPGGAVVRSAKGGYSVLHSAALIGGATVAAAVAQETALQATQQTRPLNESLLNVTSAAVLGSLLGGGIAAALTRGELRIAARGLREVTDISAGVKPNAVVDLAAVELASPAGLSAERARIGADPYTAPLRSAADLEVAGPAARAVVDATYKLNPVLRSTKRLSPAAQDITSRVAEGLIYRAQHFAGETSGSSAEAAARYAAEGRWNEGVRQHDLAYTEMRKTGLRMSRDAFAEAVGKAMVRGDTDANEHVARAAQAWRRQFDAFAKEALELGLLDAKDMTVKTAASYLARSWKRDLLLAERGAFVDAVVPYFKTRLAAAWADDKARLDRLRVSVETDKADLATAGDARAARMKALDDEMQALRAANKRHEDRLDEMRALDLRRRRARSDEERDALRRQRDDLKAQGGDELAAYRAQRAALQRRIDRLPGTQIEKGAALREQADEIAATVDRSLLAFARQAKNIMAKLAEDPVRVTGEAVQAIEEQAHRAQALVDAAQDRLARLARRGDDPAALAVQQDLLRQREQDLAEIIARLDAADARHADAPLVAEQLERMLARIASVTTERNAARQARSVELRRQAAALSPEEVTRRATAEAARLDERLRDASDRFADRWHTGNVADGFDEAARRAAGDTHAVLTGQARVGENVPDFVVKVATGPLKGRTFLVQDEAVERWLDRDVRQVAKLHFRRMAADVELTRRFGRADLRDQIATIKDQYRDIADAVDRATSVAEVNKALGQAWVKEGTPLAKAKAKAQTWAADDMAGAVEDVEKLRDLLRGDFDAGNFGAVTRMALGFNYLRQMGGALLANLGDMYRSAMVHGLRPYTEHLPGLVKSVFGGGSDAIRLSVREAELAGLVGERLRSAAIAANADLGEPLVNGMTYLERVMNRLVHTASKWNGLSYFTDFSQGMASVLSQNRILEAAVKGAAASAEDKALLRMLGVDAQSAATIKTLFERFGKVQDGVHVANTEQWLSVAVGRDQRRIEDAVRVFRVAVNSDVNGIVVRRGLGDVPLFAHTNVGKLLTQFSGYSMAAHQRVLIRGLQEDKTRLVMGVVNMSAIGMLTAYLSAWRGGSERFEKFKADVLHNPTILLAEGLDRSGVFTLPFDVANRLEKVSGGLGPDYRVNPIKTPITWLSGRPRTGYTSTRASDGSAVFGALFGPTVGLVDSALAAGRVGLDTARGVKPPKRDVNTALAVVPFQSYLGVREMLQAFTGNSPYFRP